MPVHLGWLLTARLSQPGPGLALASVDLPPPFDGGWVDFAVGTPGNPRRRHKLIASWREELQCFASDPDRWLSITLYGDLVLGDRASSVELHVAATTVEIKLVDGFATGSFVEPLVADALRPLLERYNDVDGLREPALVTPEVDCGSTLSAMSMAGITKEVSGWRGDRPLMVWDRTERDAHVVADEAIERTVDYFGDMVHERDPEGCLLGLLPEPLHDVFWPTADSFRWIGLAIASASPLAEPVPPTGFVIDQWTPHEHGASGLLCADRRYGMLDKAVGDDLTDWFARLIATTPEAVWAAASPISNPRSELGAALTKASLEHDPEPPFATWLSYVNAIGGDIIRCGPGPYPTRSLLDKAHQQLSQTETNRIVDTRQPLDDLATPTPWLQRLHPDWGQLTQSRYRREAEYIRLSGRPRNGWALKALDPDATIAETLTLTSAEWHQVIKLSGPLDASGIASWIHSGNAQMFTEYPEPIQSFLERHIGRYVAIVPAERNGSEPAPRIHRRIHSKPTFHDLDPSDVWIVVNDADGRPIENTAIDFMTLSAILTADAAELLARGQLTLARARQLANNTDNDNPDTQTAITDWNETTAALLPAGHDYRLGILGTEM